MSGTRPTIEQVDECIRMAREETFGADDPTVYMGILAAEVQALREDLRLAELTVGTTMAAAQRQAAAVDKLRKANTELQNAIDVLAGAECRADDFHRRLLRVEALGSGPGYRMGDSMLVTLGAVRAAIRGGP